ncbi:hypothetical protein SAMN05216391_109100 [Lachnospiraceae bacterium KHCPX20]|nr:hypothetical protein SAMN05216391_109100 [Lachnospiraceae bacterium KHCPX20]
MDQILATSVTINIYNFEHPIEENLLEKVKELFGYFLNREVKETKIEGEESDYDLTFELRTKDSIEVMEDRLEKVNEFLKSLIETKDLTLNMNYSFSWVY